jgi:hypothetical protein
MYELLKQLFNFPTHRRGIDNAHVTEPNISFLINNYRRRDRVDLIALRQIRGVLRPNPHRIRELTHISLKHFFRFHGVYVDRYHSDAIPKLFPDRSKVGHRISTRATPRSHEINNHDASSYLSQLKQRALNIEDRKVRRDNARRIRSIILRSTRIRGRVIQPRRLEEKYAPSKNRSNNDKSYPFDVSISLLFQVNTSGVSYAVQEQYVNLGFKDFKSEKEKARYLITSGFAIYLRLGVWS